MPTSKGKAEVMAYMNSIPAKLQNSILKGAARKAANVVADQARANTQSSEVRAAIKVKVEAEPGRVVAKVQVKGPGAYLARWEEYGTDPHFISVDDSQRNGLSVRAVNRREKAGERSLVIGGNFVGKTVHHPGARAHPFLRPALDLKQAEAIAAAQGYINSKLTKADFAGGDEGDQV